MLASKHRLVQLVETYNNLWHELREIEYDFGFKYELGDVKKWVSIGKRYEKVKQEIIRVLSDFLEDLKKEYGDLSTDKKIIALSNFLSEFRLPLFPTTNIIAKVVGCSVDYVREVDNWRARRGKLSDSVRKKVLERDNFSCVICGAKDKLEVHHIVTPHKFALPEEANRLDNLVTLCKKCHYAIHGGHFESSLLPYKSKEEFYEIIKNPFWIKLWLAVCKSCHSERDRVYQALRNRFKSEIGFKRARIGIMATLPYMTDTLAKRIKDELEKFEHKKTVT